MHSEVIFKNKPEDFFKIFLGTFLALFLIQIPSVLNSTIFLFLTVYLLDGGHVYSTLLEVLFDKSEVQKKYVSIVLLGSFLLNFIIHYFFKNLFFFYLFYFTVFHNMRQGLGLTFLYRIGKNQNPNLIKFFYYFLTLVPFFIFHLRGPVLERNLTGDILMPYYLNNLFSQYHIHTLTQGSIYFYFFIVAFGFIYLYLKKNTSGLMSLAFFAGVYSYAFLLSTNELKSYVILIFSHAIPYYFLMEKRVKLTHVSEYVRTHAWLFLLILFFVGGFIDYYQDDVVGYFFPFDSLVTAFLLTPLIAHFIFDAIIWKRGNSRFQEFVKNT